MRVVGALALASLGASPRAARANGAFPDSQSLMTPADEPGRTVLATNFGLIASVDGEQTWTWTCEVTATNLAGLYQLGPAPRRRFFALAQGRLVYSDDTGCGWHVTSGLTDEGTVVDAFPDPMNAERVLVVAAVGGDAGGTYGIYQSLDGGTHVPTRLYEAPVGDVISGVESSRSRPATLYATVSRAVEAGFVPGLLRSDDNGTSWKMAPLAGLTEGTLRLVAIDPADPATLLLRGHTNTGEFLARTSDGGAHATVVVDLPDGVLTSYARMESGHLFLGGILGLTPVLYTSSDGGATWQRLPQPPQLRALSTRSGRLYGAADKNVEDFALAISDDEGRSWQPVMDYPDVQAISGCAKTTCAMACQFEADRSVWTDDVCSATPAPRPFGDAGLPPLVDADADGAADGGHSASTASGCSCETGSSEAPPLSNLVAVVTLVAATLFRPRARR